MPIESVVRFLDPDRPGKTLPATEDDQEYLQTLYALVHDAAAGDPGEDNEERYLFPQPSV